MKNLKLNQLSFSIRAVLFNCSLMLMIPSMAQAQDVENKESPNLLVSEVAKKNNDIEIIEVSYGF